MSSRVIVVDDRDPSNPMVVPVEELPSYLRTIVRKVEDAVEGKSGQRIITASEIETALMVSAQQRIAEQRAEPYDAADPFDHGGAAATYVQLHRLLARDPLAHAADIEGCIVAMACEGEAALRGAAEKTSVGVPRDEELVPMIREPCERVGFAMHARAMWAHGGFLTFDLTRGLYDLVRRSGDDPGAANAPAATRFEPESAFAIRFPGPDYPVVDDGGGAPYEVRGVVVTQYEDAASEDVLTTMREAMEAGANALEADPDGKTTFRAMADAVSSAGRAAATATTWSTIIHLCGYRQDEKRAIGTGLENAYLVMRPGADNVPTVKDALLKGAHAAAEAAGADPAPFVEIAAVAFGTGLWLTHSDDTAHPLRARGVKVVRGHDAIRPRAYLIGRGVKQIMEGRNV